MLQARKHLRKNSFFLFIFPTLTFLPQPSHAQVREIFGGNLAEGRIAGALGAYGFPTQPLQKGRSDIKLVPAYFTFQSGQSGRPRLKTLSGFGGAVCLSHAFNSHVGLEFVGAALNGSGSDAIVDSLSGEPTGDNAASSISGTIGVLAVAIDPMPEGWAFRLPFMVGVNYQQLTDSDDAYVYGSTAGTAYQKMKVSAAGLSAGVSAQFNTGKWFRWVPFIFSNIGNKAKGTCTAMGLYACAGSSGNPQAAKYSENLGTGFLGLELTFRPWNLGFLYIPPLSLITHGDNIAEQSIYAVKWTKSFGRSSL